MKHLCLILFLLAALPALASSYFPLEPGVVWMLQREGGAPFSLVYGMGSPVLFHGASCYPRVETLETGAGGTTYWSVDEQGRILLHGLKYQSPPFSEFYFVPPAVYLDDTLQPGETTTSEVGVFEVLEYGDLWHGPFTVSLVCFDRDPVTTLLGTFAAITVNTNWTGPLAPWRYGAEGALSYGWGIGPVRVRSLPDPQLDWRLIGLYGLDLTAAPPAAPALSLTAAPNPFNPSTTLRFDLPTAGHVRIEIFDVAGRRVAVLRDVNLPAGPQTIPWRPDDLASGVYLARIMTPAAAATTRLVLLE